jgi:GT2 family glycosyltransferase
LRGDRNDMLRRFSGDPFSARGSDSSGADGHHPAIEPKSALLAPVSAIIPTKNRVDDLRLTIRTLLEQTELPSEIAIVDQSSDAQSYEAVRAEFSDARSRNSTLPELKYVRDESISGVSAARNRAMTLATKDVWLFLDDDVVVEPEFVAELMRVYRANDKVHGVSGVITNYVPPSVAYRAWLKVFARGPFLERRLPIYWQADKLRDAGLFRVKGFSGGVMSFRADVARKGRFDTRIRNGEDVDFCVSLGGDLLLVIAPRVRLRHMASPVGRSQDLWLAQFAATQSFLYAKNWRNGFGNRICFTWLCIGLGLAAMATGLRRASSKPWQDTFAGLRSGFETAKSSSVS